MGGLRNISLLCGRDFRLWRLSRMRICLPTNAPAATACVYWIHGGGLMVGDATAGIVEVLDWAQDLNIAVVSVDYRLTPETQHPGPVEDCYAGLA